MNLNHARLPIPPRAHIADKSWKMVGFSLLCKCDLTSIVKNHYVGLGLAMLEANLVTSYKLFAIGRGEGSFE